MADAPAPLATLVAVGNELLNGETVDTNGAWLGRSLGQLGIPVVGKYTVGDGWDEIQAAVRAATDRAELVVVCGGLGPTPDDLTKEAVADLLGRELLVDEALLSGLRERFRARGYDELPAPNVSQAEVPEGSELLKNPHGTAPGLLLETEGGVIVLLPGVPREMRGIFEGDLVVALRDRFAGRLEPLFHRLIHTTGVPESRLSELVEPLLPDDMGPVTLAFLPDLKGVDLRLTVRGASEVEARVWLERVEAALEPVLRPWRFEAASGDVAEALIEVLKRTGRRLAVAESCTGGLVAKRITDVPGSSRAFVGGVVAYDDAVKVRQLGVSEGDILRDGAVSETVARQMAAGVARVLGVEAGVGVTGIAGPGGGTADKPVGTVWIAAWVDGRVEASRLGLVGDRRAVRERAAQEALSHLLRMLNERAAGA
ncbi:MAG TPA: competence/damage-inducible protein A [Longimicrobiales bacterium]|nr:competence/damage-inducible protein A [Longimicrobiales bacterium]